MGSMLLPSRGVFGAKDTVFSKAHSRAGKACLWPSGPGPPLALPPHRAHGGRGFLPRIVGLQPAASGQTAWPASLGCNAERDFPLRLHRRK